MTDVLLSHTADDGEVTFTAGQPRMTDGLETAVYVSLFGGNEDDSGLEDGDRRQWWGNLGELEPSRRYRSETQHLLRSLPITSANLRAIEDAAGRDLAWLVEGGFATLVFATARIPRINTIDLEVNITVDGRVHSFNFTEQGQ